MHKHKLTAMIKEWRFIFVQNMLIIKLYKGLQFNKVLTIYKNIGYTYLNSM